MPVYEVTVESRKHGIPIIMDVEADNEDMLDPTFLSSEADRMYEGQQVINEKQRKEAGRQAEANLVPTPADPAVVSGLTSAFGGGPLGRIAADKLAPKAGAFATGALDVMGAGIPSNVMKALGYPSAEPFSAAPVSPEDKFSPQAENPGAYGAGNIAGGVLSMIGGPKGTGMMAPLGVGGGMPSIARRLGTAAAGGARMGAVFGTGEGVGSALRESPLPTEGESTFNIGPLEVRPELLMEAIPSTLVGTAAGATLGAGAAGLPAAVRPFTQAGRKERAVKLLQGRAKPTPRGKTGQSFDEVGENFLRLANEGKPVVNTIDDGVAAGENALSKISTTRLEPMISSAEQRGVQIDLTAAAQNIERLSAEPYYKFLDPDGAIKLMEEAANLKGRQASVREAQSLLTFLNKRARALRQRTGTSADATEARSLETLTESYEEMADGIRRQLNERVSRKPNEFLEAYRDWANVDEVTDLLKIAKVRQGNLPEEQLLKVVSDSMPKRDVSILGKLLPRQTADTDVSKAFRLAGKIKLNPPTPFGPQKPSMLPQIPPSGSTPPPPPTTPPVIPPGGGGGGNVPVSPAPVAPTPAPLTMKQYLETQIDLFQKSGFSSEQANDFIKNGGGSQEVKDATLKFLSGELSEADTINIIKSNFGRLVDPSVPVPGPPEPPKPPAPLDLPQLGKGKPFVPIDITPNKDSGEVFLDPPSPKGDKQNFIRPPGPTRPPTPGSSATEMGGRSRHPETRANVFRGSNDPVEVVFKDKMDKIAFGGGKKPGRIVKGEYVSSAAQTKQASELLKGKYPKAELRQISAAMRDYNKFIVDMAGLQEKSGADLKIEPLTFDEFVKTTYPSIFGGK